MIRSEGCRPPSLLSSALQAGRNPGQAAVALVGVVGHLDGRRERGGERREALPVLAGLGEREEPRLRLLDLLLGREVDRAVVGHVHHVLADHDQLAAHGEVVDGAGVVAHVDDGGGVGRELAEVGRHAQAGADRLGALEEGLERDRRRLLAGADQLGGGLVDLLMQRVEEVLRLQEAGDAVVRLVVDEDGAEQRLLGLQVVGSRPEGQRVGRGEAASRPASRSMRRAVLVVLVMGPGIAGVGGAGTVNWRHQRSSQRCQPALACTQLATRMPLTPVITSTASCPPSPRTVIRS